MSRNISGCAKFFKFCQFEDDCKIPVNMATINFDTNKIQYLQKFLPLKYNNHISVPKHPLYI